MSNISIQDYINEISHHMRVASMLSQELQAKVLEIEGDSDLHRKLSCYLTPMLTHWTMGAQAGNPKDLQETLARRLAAPATNNVESHTGDGHEVLTEPKK